MTTGSEYLKRRFPNGYAVLASSLLDTLQRGDGIACPIELWDDDMLALQGAQLRQTLKSMRDSWSADQAIARQREHGSTLSDAALRDDAKAVRKHLSRIEQEAEALHASLVRRIKNPKTRDMMFIRLRTWREVAGNPNIPPAVAGRYLIDALEDSHLDMPSDGVTRGILKAYERAEFQRTDESEWPVARGIANGASSSAAWVYELAPRDVGEAREQLLPAPDIDAKTAAAMAKYAGSLGDRDSDLMIKAMARFAERAKHAGDHVAITIDELCDALGYTRHKNSAGGSSFRPEDKATVRTRFEQLQAGYLTIYGAGKLPGGRRNLDVESRVLTIHERAGQADFNGRVPEWTSVTIGFGTAWASPLFDKKGRMTALLQEKTLTYDPIKQRLEKRIGKRLGWHWKINIGRESAGTTRTVAQWIRDDVGDAPETYDRRQAERFEQAFDALARDGLIGAWGYTGHQERIDRADGKQTRGWLERWLEREVIVEMPGSLKLAYAEQRPVRKQSPAAPTLPAPGAAPTGAKFGEAFREFRLARGISGLQASKETHIHNTTLSQIETGKREPSDKHRQAMAGWMRDLTNRPDKLAARYADAADGS